MLQQPLETNTPLESEPKSWPVAGAPDSKIFLLLSNETIATYAGKAKAEFHAGIFVFKQNIKPVVSFLFQMCNLKGHQTFLWMLEPLKHVL